MGHNPIPPRSTAASVRALAESMGGGLEIDPRSRRWRRSIFPWRRRAAYAACLRNIARLERELGLEYEHALAVRLGIIPPNAPVKRAEPTLVER